MSETSPDQPPLAMLYVCAESLLEGAAAHVHVNEIMAGLARRGWQCTLIEPHYDRQPARPGLVKRMSAIAGVNYRAWRRLRDVRAIYCRANPLLWPVAWVARRRGVVVVQESNGHYSDIAIAHPWTQRVFWLFKGMQRWQYRHANAVVTVTEKYREWLVGERGRSDVRLIENGANTDLFTPDVEPASPAPEPFVVFFGALAAWHGVGTMLKAKAHPDWPIGIALAVVGAGAETPQVEAAAAGDPTIHYVGRQPYKSIPGLIVRSLAGLVPIENVGGRASAGSPLKLYETLAAGVPVLATDLPPQADFVRRYDCGMLVPPGDPGALARAVAAVARDPGSAQRMGARGRTAVVAEHSWDHRAGEVDRLLRETLRRKA